MENKDILMISIVNDELDTHTHKPILNQDHIVILVVPSIAVMPAEAVYWIMTILI